MAAYPGDQDGGQARASARIQRSITDKRDGRELPEAEISGVVADFVAGLVPDYQMSAWLATVACRGLTIAETAALTSAYVAGGERLDLRRLDRTVLDKHSTGGVGDKVSLIVVPIVAACGVAVVKMSGRGLGHAGGTIDKLESITGLRLDLTPDEVYATVAKAGMVITGQSAALAPGDGATYALRDVTGTVESVPLIAASIISKKVAVGAHGLVLDVKTGAGALLPDRGLATELARTMVELATMSGLRCRAVLSDMSQPLGHAVGNALELIEALAVLRGDYVPRVTELCVALCRLLLQSAEPGLTGEEADLRIAAVLSSGAAHEQFVRWTDAQGGDARMIEDPSLLPHAPRTETITAGRAGWVRAVDPRAIGHAALRIGAGRLAHGAAIDPGAGVRVACHVGAKVDAGDRLAELYYTSGDIAAATDLARSAFVIGEEQPAEPPLIHQIFT